MTEYGILRTFTVGIPGRWYHSQLQRMMGVAFVNQVY
jgi:hypothetical protein